MRYITLMDVAKEEGLETTTRIHVKSGNRLSKYHLKSYGTLPTKELRPKTNGPGKHCIAVYPENMRGVIVSTLHDAIDEQQEFDRQMEERDW